MTKFIRALFFARVSFFPVKVVAMLLVAAGDNPVCGAVSMADELARGNYARIDLRRTSDHHLFIFGMVNGKKRSVLVDTGWSLTTVAKRAAGNLRSPEALGVQCAEPAFGTNEQSALVLIEALKLGGIMLTNQPAVVRDLTFGGQSAPFDAVLGCDFLLRHGAIIDCENRRLYLRSREPTVSESEQFTTQLRHNSFVPVGMQIIQRPLAMVCDAKLNQEPLQLLVDTAAVWSCVDIRYAQRLALKLSPTPRRISGVGKTGIRGFAVTTVRSLTLGDLEMSDLNLAVFDLRAWGLAEPDTTLAGVRGILGGSELTARAAVIDCGRRTLWLKLPRPRK